jgi:hypothetical protein
MVDGLALGAQRSTRQRRLGAFARAVAVGEFGEIAIGALVGLDQHMRAMRVVVLAHRIGTRDPQCGERRASFGSSAAGRKRSKRRRRATGASASSANAQRFVRRKLGTRLAPGIASAREFVVHAVRRANARGCRPDRARTKRSSSLGNLPPCASASALRNGPSRKACKCRSSRALTVTPRAREASPRARPRRGPAGSRPWPDARTRRARPESGNSPRDRRRSWDGRRRRVPGPPVHRLDRCPSGSRHSANRSPPGPAHIGHRRPVARGHRETRVDRVAAGFERRGTRPSAEAGWPATTALSSPRATRPEP